MHTAIGSSAKFLFYQGTNFLSRYFDRVNMWKVFHVIFATLILLSSKIVDDEVEGKENFQLNFRRGKMKFLWAREILFTSRQVNFPIQRTLKSIAVMPLCASDGAQWIRNLVSLSLKNIPRGLSTVRKIFI